MTENGEGVDDATLGATGASFAFGDVTILDGADVELRSGEFTALVGPNGSGKTTVLELLAGLRALDAGAVTRPETPGRSVAYLPQTPGFRAGFTARDTVGFYADLVDADTDPDALLARVGLEGAADRPVEALSGGMTRLLGIAQALIGDPPVVVLDEPTSGLDPDVADHVFDVIDAVADEGRLVVTASHDLAAVEERADRVLLLADGAFVLDGPPETALAATGTERLRAAFSAAVATEEREGRGRVTTTGGED